MWQTKYASTVPKKFGVGVDFGRAMKANSSPGVRSPCCKPLKEPIKDLRVGVDFGSAVMAISSPGVRSP